MGANQDHSIKKTNAKRGKGQGLTEESLLGMKAGSNEQEPNRFINVTHCPAR